MTVQQTCSPGRGFRDNMVPTDERVTQTAAIIKQSGQKMVRHRVYPRVTSYDLDGKIQRDSVGVGGRRTVGSAKVEFNCDTTNGQDTKIVVRVTVDEDGRGSVDLQCPTEFKLHLNKPQK